MKLALIFLLVAKATATPATFSHLRGADGEGADRQLSHAEEPIALGACEDFALMAGSTATCAGSDDCEIIGGSLGVYPGTSYTGNFAGDFVGDIAPTHDSADCAEDGLAAWNAGIAMTTGTPMLAEMGGVTFTPGVYIHESSINHALGVHLDMPQVYIDAEGDTDAVFIFNVGTTLTTCAGSEIVLVNGAKAENVFWVLGTGLTMGADSTLVGTVLAGSAITMGTNAKIVGRAIAQTAVTCETACAIETSGRHSAVPSASPSTGPSAGPSSEPSSEPSAAPSVEPSTVPSASPSTTPSVVPSSLPSGAPSVVPSSLPSGAPSVVPSSLPSGAPSVVPSSLPSGAPSVVPSSLPSGAPSVIPSSSPSTEPSASPISQPSSLPNPGPYGLKCESLGGLLIPDVSDYELVYKLNVPDKSNFQNDVPYVTDNSNSGSIGDFSRIAYYMELEHPTFLSQWVWVSMDAFTTDASKIGVPTFSSGAIFQESVPNVDVYSNVQPLCAEGLEGNLEFWPTNYGRHNADNISGASGNVFDFGDRRHGGGGYGSMQIHVASLETTVFAFNNWNAANADMGIGNNPNGHPDWTHTGNSAQYTVKTLEVWVK